MSDLEDVAVSVLGPTTGACFNETIAGAAAPNAAAIELEPGFIYHFSSDNDFILLMGPAASLGAPDLSASTPAVPSATAGEKLFGGQIHPVMVEQATRFFRWTSLTSDQQIRYRKASPAIR